VSLHYPGNTLATEWARWVDWRLWKGCGQCDKLATDEFQCFPWTFKYWLTGMRCTFLGDKRSHSTVTFSAICAVHGLPFPGRLSTLPVSMSYLTASEDFARSDSYSTVQRIR